jgi:nucleoside phosphorylase
MKIAIMAPMPSELAPVIKAFTLTKSSASDPVRYEGRIGDTEIVATKTGIGTAGAKQATEAILDATGADHVMVVGIAGGVGPTVKIGDLVFPEVVIDKASGRELRPTHLGAPTARGTIVTSDDFLIEPGQVERMTADGVIALDMETSAVALVCEERGTDWSVIRAISDMATDHPDDAVLGLAKPDGSPNGPAIAKFLLTKPWRIPMLAKLQQGAKLAASNAARAAASACGSR